MESVNWAWGLSLIALTIAIHATGLSFLAFGLRSVRVRLESQSLGLRRHAFATVIGAITALGLLLAVLHGIEAALWAAAYLWLNALASPEAAILYSVDSMATRGASGLALEQHWRMMGALEAFDGMLLFGISTAFIFAVLQIFWPMLVTPKSLIKGAAAAFDARRYGRAHRTAERPASTCAVTRRRFSSGCKPHPATAPAGSDRSRHGGDEMSEAFG